LFILWSNSDLKRIRNFSILLKIIWISFDGDFIRRCVQPLQKIKKKTVFLDFLTSGNSRCLKIPAKLFFNQFFHLTTFQNMPYKTDKKLQKNSNCMFVVENHSYHAQKNPGQNNWLPLISSLDSDFKFSVNFYLRFRFVENIQWCVILIWAYTTLAWDYTSLLQGFTQAKKKKQKNKCLYLGTKSSQIDSVLRAELKNALFSYHT